MLAKLTGPTLPPLAGGAPGQVVVLLHGYGSNGADLIALAPLWRTALPHALFIAPDAPDRCPNVPGGRQWFALTSFSRAMLATGAAHAAPAIDGFLDALLAEHALADDRLLLVGFSQGTMMALHIGLRRPRLPAGIVGYSGMLATPAVNGGAAPPVLLIHGAADPVVPVAMHREAMAELRRADIAVEGHVSDRLGHFVDAAGLALGGRFASRVLGEPPQRVGTGVAPA